MVTPNKEKEEVLTVDYLRECLEYFPDTGRFVWKTRPVEHFKDEWAMKIWNTKNAGKEAFTVDSGTGYKQGAISRNGKKYKVYAHRIAWAMSTGAWPDEQVDHIDGERVDNRLDNLRPACHKTNQRNAAMRSNNTSGVVGVSRYRHNAGCWISRINDNNGKQINLTNPDTGLKYFTDQVDAIYARYWAERGLGYHENHGRSS